MLKPLERFLEKTEKAALIFLFCIMIGLSFAQVILRAGFSTGLLWADTFLRHLVLWVGFLGAVLAVNQNKHFAIDVVRKFFPQNVQDAVEIITDILAVAVLCLLSHSAIKFLEDDVRSGGILFRLGQIEVPSAGMNVIIPASFLLLAIHFAFKLMGDIERMLSRAQPDGY